MRRAAAMLALWLCAIIRAFAQNAENLPIVGILRSNTADSVEPFATGFRDALAAVRRSAIRLRFRALLIAAAALMLLGEPAAAQKIISPGPNAPSPAPSQPPSPDLGEQHDQPPASEHQDAQPDRRGSVDAPLIVEMHYPPKTEQQAADNAEKQERKISTDRWTIRLTIALVVATGLQFLALGYQGYWLQRAVKASQDEFNASHRPRIRVREVAIATDGFDAPLSFGVGKTIYARFAIANVGDSEAIITEVYAKIFRTNLPLPMRAPPMNSVLNHQFTIKPAFIVGLEEFPDDEPLIESYIAGDLYVMGTITYTDIGDPSNQRARKIFFCRHFRANPPSFQRVDNQDYESEC